MYIVDLLDHTGLMVMIDCSTVSECIKFLDNTTITISFIYIEILCILNF